MKINAFMSVRTVSLACLLASGWLVLALASPAFGQDGKAGMPNPKFHAKDAINLYNVSKLALAIEGYDPVAYFPEGGGKPRKGDKGTTFTHNGITYRFTSKEHLELFKSNPDKYEPAHGGWCTYAMGASGEKVEVDPESYVVENGRLFLFYKGFFADTRKQFLADKAKLLSAADDHWRKAAGEEPRTPEGAAKEKAKPEEARPEGDKEGSIKDGKKPDPAEGDPKNPK